MCFQKDGVAVVFVSQKFGFFAIVFALILSSRAVTAQDAIPASNIQVPLVVNAGVPFRVYITKRLHMRAGEPVTARSIEPIYAFDRVVVPAGVELVGHVTGFNSVPKMARAQAILGGDFTPLHFARVEFTTIVMPDGHKMAIRALEAEGLPTIYVAPRPSKKKAGASQPNTGVMAVTKEQIQQQINARSQGVIEMIRGPNKKEWIEDFLIKKLPYHPQWYRSNTRFDAVLRDPIDLGMTAAPGDMLRNIGLPAGDLITQVRLTTPLSSADADTNTRVEGVLSQPVFSASHQLVLPEGTLLTGRVRRAQPARWFHRGGQLRFTFDRIEPPAWTSLAPIPLERKEIQLANVEPDPKAHIQIDSEGNAKSTEPKSRLLGPVIALIVAGRSADGDNGRDRVGTATPGANRGGRGLGGLSGFGLAGSAAAQASKTAGAALGYYGFAWSVYSTIISRGREVEFQRNTAIEVRFGAQPAAPPKTVRGRLWGILNR
jgi:hypothetical protein